MKIRFLFLICVISINGYGQDTLYVGEFGGKIVSKSQAKYYKIVEKDSLSHDVFIERNFHLDGTLKSKVIYDKYSSKNKHRLSYKSYYKSGKIQIDISYKKGKKNGYFLSYWGNGILKRKDQYKMDRLVEGQCWDEKGKPVSHYDFEIDTKFPEGKKALYRYIAREIGKSKIPKSAIGSKVVISFYVDQDGSISDVKILNGTDDLLTNYKIIKIVSEMPKWIPAMQDGKPVKVRRVLPISL